MSAIAPSRIAQLQFITMDATSRSHAEQARLACEAGVRWVQVRIKGMEPAEWENEARQVVRVCREFGAVCIINDNPEIALKVQADGVHVGKGDMTPSKARAIIGEYAIIGGTANTLSDVERLIESRVDYIGLGPLRYTSTKTNLSPVLGLLGVQAIMDQLREKNINVPVIVIGGVAPSDKGVLHEFGVHGIAVSSAIASAGDVAKAAEQFLEERSYG